MDGQARQLRAEGGSIPGETGEQVALEVGDNLTVKRAQHCVRLGDEDVQRVQSQLSLHRGVSDALSHGRGFVQRNKSINDDRIAGKPKLYKHSLLYMIIPLPDNLRPLASRVRG